MVILLLEIIVNMDMVTVIYIKITGTFLGQVNSDT
jgi:hypothetical protein